MTAKMQIQERPLSEWIQRFQKLLPKKDPENIQNQKRDEMARLIGLLYKRRGHRVDFYKLWNTLLWLPNLKSRLEARKRRISEFKGRKSETTEIREWARKRNRIRRNLTRLLEEVEELFQEVYRSDPWIFRTLVSLKVDKGEIMKNQDRNLLVLSRRLLKALRESPLFLAEPLRREPGHQPAPWLQDAKRRFQEASVPQTVGNELLRLMNIKPPHTI